MKIVFEHQPIMASEIVEYLRPKEGDFFVDGTLGGAGHSSLIAQRIGKTGTLLGIDKDADALQVCKERLEKFSNTILVHDDFKNIKDILSERNITLIDGALLDLGISSYQIDTPERGFSIRYDGPLDMRMDKRQTWSAYDVVNTFDKAKLIRILKEYGEETFAPIIVNAIVKQRAIKPIETTLELKNLIEQSLPAKVVYKSGGSSKKTFQAIRIYVNGELEGLENALQVLIDHLKSGGRLAVLTFHSLEDRIVKNLFKENTIGCICPPKFPVCMCNRKAKAKLVTKKAETASELEILQNSRSTSAKLRVIEKI